MFEKKTFITLKKQLHILLWIIAIGVILNTLFIIWIHDFYSVKHSIQFVFYHTWTFVPIIVLDYILFIFHSFVYKNKKRTIQQYLADFLLLIAFFLTYMTGSLLAYTLALTPLSLHYSHGMNALFWDLYLAVTLLLFPYLIQRPNRFRMLPIFIVLLGLFLAYDIYANVMLSNVHFILFLQISEIWPYLSLTYKSLIILLPSIVLLLIMLNLRWNIRNFLIYALFGFVFSTVSMGVLLTLHLSYNVTTFYAQTQHYGRLYNYIFTKASLNKIKPYQNRNLIKNLSFYIPEDKIKQHIKYHNVYVIIEESYFNADHLINLLSQAKSVTTHKSIRSFGNKNINRTYYGKKESIAISPVLGGRSVESQFEIFCQAPALSLYGMNDNAVVKGSPSYCIPTILGNIGYKTILFSAYGKPNTWNFQKSLGFQTRIEINRKIIGLPLLKNKILNKKLAFSYTIDQSGIFDGVVFDRITKDILPILLKKHRPFFFSIYTMSGHYPINRDKKLRPDRFTNINNDILHRFVNSYYYRTIALNKFITTIRKKDPNGIIIVLGDHLLSRVLYNKYKYLYDLYPKVHFDRYHAVTGVILISHNKIQTLRMVPNFELSRWILNELTDGWYCTQISCDFSPHFNPLSTYYTKEKVQDYNILMGIASIPLSQTSSH